MAQQLHAPMPTAFRVKSAASELGTFPRVSGCSSSPVLSIAGSIVEVLAVLSASGLWRRQQRGRLQACMSACLCVPGYMYVYSCVVDELQCGMASGIPASFLSG